MKNFISISEPVKYNHNCDSCKYLGKHFDHENNASCDLYFCKNSGSKHSTVIARYSDEESDYQSGLNSAFEGGSEILWEAAKRAITYEFLTLADWEKATSFGRGR